MLQKGLALGLKRKVSKNKFTYLFAVHHCYVALCPPPHFAKPKRPARRQVSDVLCLLDFVAGLGGIGGWRISSALVVVLMWWFKFGYGITDFMLNRGRRMLYGNGIGRKVSKNKLLVISLIFRQSTTAVLPSVHLHTLRDQSDQLGDKVLMFFACSVLWLVLEGLVVGVSPPLWWWYWCGGLKCNC